MQIREQGKKIQLLRSIYNPELKKCKQVLVGSINRYEMQLSGVLQAKLTAEELTQFNEWVKRERLNSISRNNQYHLSYAEANLAKITCAISADTVDQVKIDSIKVALRVMQKAIRKAEKALRSESQLTQP